MKKITIWGIGLLGLVLCANCSASSGEGAGTGPGKDEEKETPDEGITDRTRQEIAAFFADYLSGKVARYDASIGLAASEIDASAEMVWELWKRANDGFAEEKLPAPGPLADVAPGRWALPAALEPNAVMPYYWGTKGSAGAQKGYPLFLYLHGSGDKNSEWATGLSLGLWFDDAPSAYFIPQIPNTGAYYRWWQRSKQFAWEKLLRLAFVSGRIDPDRVYFFGISEGGYGSQRLASFYADYLAGAGPMAGGEPLKNAPAENCANIAFSLRTGADDSGFHRNRLTSYTKDEFDRLEREHPGYYTHHIELIPGMGHGIDYNPTTPYLKQFVRNPHPRYVCWENFEMDGRRRTGFYNLYAGEQANASAGVRMRYEMTIAGNAISLQVDEVTYTTTEVDPDWGIEMKFAKSRVPATRGKLTVYLCDELVDPEREVTLTVNGKEAFRGMLRPDLKHLVNSCAAFFDPRRLYPAAVEIDLSRL